MENISQNRELNYDINAVNNDVLSNNENNNAIVNNTSDESITNNNNIKNHIYDNQTIIYNDTLKNIIIDDEKMTLLMIGKNIKIDFSKTYEESFKCLKNNKDYDNKNTTFNPKLIHLISFFSRSKTAIMSIYENCAKEKPFGLNALSFDNMQYPSKNKCLPIDFCSIIANKMIL